jgi:hypothetical protein
MPGRKRGVVYLAALILACIPLGSTSAHASSAYPCFGAPADYVAAFDTARGQAADGAVTYAEPRWYDEQQSWATHALAFPGHHSDHIHMGRCVPNGETWTATNRPMDVEYTFHNDTAYTVKSAGMSYLWGDPNAGPTAKGYAASATQIAELQAAADASGGGVVTHAFQSYQMAVPPVNGFKEVRNSLSLVRKTVDAVFPTWILDARWYETDNVAGLTTAAGINGQIAVRNRSHVTFPKAGDPATIQDDYHHSGWCGMTGTPFGSTQTAGSALFTRSLLAPSWTGDRSVCLYVSDGGGPALLMIDPDFHHHYDAPTAACPNVDANGNCLGVWYWQPTGVRHEIFGGAGGQQNVAVTIPGSVLAALTPGPHRLVFRSDDFPDCVRNNNFTSWSGCPADVRGEWTNISVLPFLAEA